MSLPSGTETITLITGTRKGIGKFLAEHFCARGHKVIGLSRGATEWTHENYEHFEADVSDESAITRLMMSIRKKYGKLDNLINNAGIAAMNHSLTTPVSVVDKVLSTNFRGTFLVCREAAKLMSTKRTGRIVNFSTVAVPLKVEGESVYAASKAAVASYSQILARELAPYGITVNLIGPCPIETDLIRNVPKEKIDKLLAQQAIKRLGTYEDVANAVGFFLRAESHFVTGQTLYLGGVS